MIIRDQSKTFFNKDARDEAYEYYLTFKDLQKLMDIQTSYKQKLN